MENLKSKFVRGTLWTLLEKFSLQFVGFGVSMILSRLLTPGDYGTVALLSVFMSVAGSLTDFGFGSALVQKKDATELDFNSVFYISIFLSSVAYGVLFLAAPFIAEFYARPELCPILRVTALSFIFGAINSVQGAELTRKMLFNLSFRISLISTIPAVVVGIVCAFKGFGPWALVWQGFTSGIVGVIARWIIIAWRPRLMFSFKSLKGLFSFGWKMSVNSILDSWADDVYQFVVGKFYSPADLAYLNKGKSTPKMLMNAINGTICRVTFPALASFQEDKARVRSAFRRIVQASCFFIFPSLMGFAACCHNMLTLFFGHQWDAAVPYAQCACFQLAQWPLALVQMVLAATGNSGDLLKINIIRKLFLIVVMAATLWISPLAYVAAVAFVYTPITTWSNNIPSKRIFGYTFWNEICDVAPIAAATGVMMLVVWGIDLLMALIGLGGDQYSLIVFRLALQISFGAATYCVMSYLLRVSAMGEYARLFLPTVKSRFSVLAPMMECLIRRTASQGSK